MKKHRCRAAFGEAVAVRTYSPTAKLVYRAWWAALLMFIAIGVVASRDHPPRHALWLIPSIALLISAAQSVYYVVGRHRLAIEPLVMPLAALSAISVTKLATRG